MLSLSKQSNLRAKASRIQSIADGSGTPLATVATLTASEGVVSPIDIGVTSGNYDIAYTATWTPIPTVGSVVLDLEVILDTVVVLIATFSTRNASGISNQGSPRVDGNVNATVVPQTTDPLATTTSSDAVKLRSIVPNTGAYAGTFRISKQSLVGLATSRTVQLVISAGVVHPT